MAIHTGIAPFGITRGDWTKNYVVVCFLPRPGGYDGANRGDTWVYDLSDNTWTNQALVSSRSAAEWTANAPSARYDHAMAYLGEDQVLLFGGYDGAYDDETWVYDLSDNTWTNQAPVSSRSAAEWTASAPSVRSLHAMAYLGGDQALLFGGYDTGNYYGDTWVYDLSANTWTNQFPVGPSARDLHAVAYLGGDQAFLFGGWNGSFLGDTWVYDLGTNTWTNRTLVSSRGAAEWTAGAPSARRGHALAPLSRDQLLLFGGYDAGGYDAETWLATGFYYNQPPVTVAGPDQTVRPLALVTLDGSGSIDPDGALPLTYLWAQTGGPAVTFTPHLSVTTFTAPGDPAVLTFTLTVTDSLGAPDPTPDEVVIAVQAYRVYLPLVMRNH